MMYYLFNGDNLETHETVESALAGAEDCISIAQDYCDPEWPDWVNHITIYTYSGESKEDDFIMEDGNVIYYSTECNERPAEDGACDYYCDYRMVTYG